MDHEPFPGTLSAFGQTWFARPGAAGLLFHFSASTYLGQALFSLKKAKYAVIGAHILLCDIAADVTT